VTDYRKIVGGEPPTGEQCDDRPPCLACGTVFDLLRRQQELIQGNADRYDEIKRLKTNNDALYREKVRLEAERDDLKVRLDSLRGENDRLVKQRDSATYKVFEERGGIDGLTLINARLIEERNQANERRQEAQESVEEWREKFHALEADRNNWEKLCGEWKQKYKRLKDCDDMR
jgi:FtsZ-binding cell division protein ZapB